MEFDIDDMREFLEREAALINRPEFISDDPVQFPRRFESLADIEIVALLSSAIAWGNRKMICRDADRMLALMEHQPYRYMMERGYEDLDPDMNIHRTFLHAIFPTSCRVYAAYMCVMVRWPISPAPTG